MSIPPYGSREYIGPSQVAMLRRAVGDAHGMVMADWRNNVEVCAIKRLTARGLLEKGTFGAGGYTITVYTITDAGRRAWRKRENGD